MRPRSRVVWSTTCWRCEPGLFALAFVSRGQEVNLEIRHEVLAMRKRSMKYVPRKSRCRLHRASRCSQLQHEAGDRVLVLSSTRARGFDMHCSVVDR